MPRNIHQPTQLIPRTLIIGVDAPYNRISSIPAYFEEFASLVRTNQNEYNQELFLKIRDVDPVYFFTKGKLDTVQQACLTNDIEHVIISEPLTAQQERNLEDFLECSITDRTRLILEIFEKAAFSAEGKTQVAIAMLQHQKSRLAGRGVHLSQQTGVTGARGGPGEKLKEKMRRRIDETITKHKRSLVRIQQARQTQRKRRLDHQVPHICLVGYTNAGKSTILNALTRAGVLAQDKLFATLDTTTRELFIEGQNKGIISDTVGFIQQLPPHLVEAFKSTLSELEYADLLLHVIDLSDANWKEHIRVVNTILSDINVHKEMLYIFNKADKLTQEEIDGLSGPLAQYRPHVIVSAQSKEGMQPLRDYLATWRKS